MRDPRWHQTFGAVMLIGALTLAACGDPAGPAGDDEVNPALLEAGGGPGSAVGGSTDLPQGDAQISGPDGMLMDATAEEFIQQFTTQGGEVWKTSGINVRAVPDESVQAPPIDRMVFFAAYPGTLESVDPGLHTVMPKSEWPAIDFTVPARVNGAGISLPDESEFHYESAGTFEITSVEYSAEVHTCELDVNSADIDVCEYQLGSLRGTIQFEVAMEDGTVVQRETDITVPIRRRTIVGTFRDF